MQLRNNSTLEKKIIAFRDLPQEWSDTELEHTEYHIIDMAIELSREMSFDPKFEIEAFLGPDGSILLILQNEEHYLEFAIEEDRSIAFLIEAESAVLSKFGLNAEGRFSVEGIDLETAKQYAKKYKEMK